MGTLISLIIALIVAGFLLWAAKLLINLVPMDDWIKQVINVIIMIAVVGLVIFYVIIPLLHMLPTTLKF